MDSRTTKLTKGRKALSGRNVLALSIVCVIAGPLFFALSLFLPGFAWGYGALATLLGVWTIDRIKARKSILPLQSVPVSEASCIRCSRKTNLAIVDYQFHYLDVENLPQEYEFFDGIINEYGHASSALLSICHRCVLSKSKRELAYVLISLTTFTGLSYLPMSPFLEWLDIIVRGALCYGLLALAYYYLQLLFPWRKRSEEVGLELAERTKKDEHPSWQARGNNSYRRHLEQQTIEPVLDDDDEFLPMVIGLVAAHVMGAAIWLTIGLTGSVPWFWDL